VRGAGRERRGDPGWRRGPWGDHREHRRWHERYRQAMNPTTWYVRRSLHRRIFYLLGASIVFTAFIVMAVVHFTTDRGSAGYKREIGQLEAFTTEEFSHVWGVPAERDRLARLMAVDLDLDLTLRDPSGKSLGSFGAAPCGKAEVTVPVYAEGGPPQGSVDVCFERGHGRHAGQVVLPLLVFGVMLWGASGRLARRLTRPYSELARVASEIGAGKLSSRYALDCRGMDEARVLADSINDMATRIEKQMADQRELLAAVSHEIRTPLARIRLLAELMRGDAAGKTDADPAFTAKALDDLDREVIEIDALVSELLASSRVDFAALSVHTLDAVDVARRALERAGLPADLLQVTASQTKLEADATLLARALANLLANAEAHGGGAKGLIVRDTADRIVFEVEDSGPGFAPGEEAKVFESFYRRARDPAAPEAPAEKGALGLGLTLVKRIAVAHGGSAFAENRERGGARVGIALPV
jgi:two-component system OmpR family sensor kinase